MRFALVNGLGDEAELIQFDVRIGATRRQKTALRSTVGTAQRSRVPCAKDEYGLVSTPAEEIVKWNFEPYRDLPEHRERRVRPRALDLR
jgi:hypothetical protein